MSTKTCSKLTQHLQRTYAVRVIITSDCASENFCAHQSSHVTTTDETSRPRPRQPRRRYLVSEKKIICPDGT
ncbi:hypothetical protein NECAME_08221 [Necator americanus]|uniref:Uncharacterized protein n=1 Tax=Necator americanus TaxID=51031 RepID=W2TK63_NECAM|nr:hypothetical protein NECAME_08221 [Necator americanus]ETN82014.1 hypothetical protein NECAME_08221 [Necator americanus]